MRSTTAGQSAKCSKAPMRIGTPFALLFFWREERLRQFPCARSRYQEEENLMNRKSVLSLSIMALAAWLFMFSATSVQAATSNNKKDVKTTVKIRTTTQIGSTTLSPGKYSVKIAPASDGRSDPTVQFSIVSNTY